jgi:hypothetical protein
MIEYKKKYRFALDIELSTDIEYPVSDPELKDAFERAMEDLRSEIDYCISNNQFGTILFELTDSKIEEING